jgi:hypothetical protein
MTALRVLRSVAAIVAGYGVMSLTVIGGTIIAASLFVPGGMPAVAGGALTGLPAAYLAANLATGALGAVLGGWLTARIAAVAPLGHAAVLAVFPATLALGAATTNMPAGPQPGWYPIAIGVIGVAGVLTGGKLRAAAADAAAADGPVVA